MIIDGKFTIEAPIQTVWDSLLDPETLGKCVPGTEKMAALDADTYESVVKQRVGPFKVTLKFTTKLTEKRPPQDTTSAYIKAEGRGADVTKLGTFSTEMEVNLTETSPNNVEVAYMANISLVGKLATFGERIMRAKSKEVGDQFTENLQKRLKA
jgi:carbon monoxide dehydrogenase subunit G